MAKRRTLILANGSRFVFTPKTVSVDVSRLFAKPGTLPPERHVVHVGRTRAALEVEGAKTIELSLDVAADLLFREQCIRFNTGEPAVRTLFDPRLWRDVQRHAEHLRAVKRDAAPFGAKPGRRCFETRGKHPGEFLWVDTLTGEAAIETRTEELDAKGRPTGYSSRVRIVSPEEAIRWLETDWDRLIPGEAFAALRRAADAGRD